MRTVFEPDVPRMAAFLAVTPLHREWTPEQLQNCARIRLETDDGVFAGYFWMHFDGHEPDILMSHMAVTTDLRGRIDYSDLARRIATLGAMMAAREIRATYTSPDEAHAFHRIWRRHAPVKRDGCVLSLELKDY